MPPRKKQEVSQSMITYYETQLKHLTKLIVAGDASEETLSRLLEVSGPLEAYKAIHTAKISKVIQAWKPEPLRWD